METIEAFALACTIARWVVALALVASPLVVTACLYLANRAHRRDMIAMFDRIDAILEDTYGQPR